MTARDAILAMPDEALVPVGYVRKALAEVVDSGGAWCGIVRAAALTGEAEGWLRYNAAGWAEMERPPIRVRKRGGRPRSPWEFREDDCAAWAMEHSEDEVEATLDDCADLGARLEKLAIMSTSQVKKCLQEARSGGTRLAGKTSTVSQSTSASRAARSTSSSTRFGLTVSASRPVLQT